LFVHDHDSFYLFWQKQKKNIFGGVVVYYWISTIHGADLAVKPDA